MKTGERYDMDELLYIEYNGKKVTYEEMITINPSVNYYLDSSISIASFEVVASSSGVFNGKNTILKAVNNDTQNQKLKIYDRNNILSEYYGINVATPMNIVVE